MVSRARTTASPRAAWRKAWQHIRASLGTRYRATPPGTVSPCRKRVTYAAGMGGALSPMAAIKRGWVSETRSCFTSHRRVDRSPLEKDLPLRQKRPHHSIPSPPLRQGPIRFVVGLAGPPRDRWSGIVSVLPIHQMEKKPARAVPILHGGGHASRIDHGKPSS
jgi:hypothetical protein